MLPLRLLFLGLMCVCLCASRPQRFNHNLRLLERLGFGRSSSASDPVGIQSRRIPGNSPMFLIKLPPSQYYYHNHLTSARKPSQSQKLNRIPLEFTSNGRPHKIYHYNLGVPRPILDEGLEGSSQASSTTSTTSTTTTTTTTTTTPTPVITAKSRPVYRKYKPYKPTTDMWKKKYHNVYKTGRLVSPDMRKYTYSNNGKPSSVYLLNSSGERQPILYSNSLV